MPQRVPVDGRARPLPIALRKRPLGLDPEGLLYCGDEVVVHFLEGLDLDDPALAVDAATGAQLWIVIGEQVMELLRELHAEGHTIIIITHDRDLAATFPRQIALLDGLIEFDRRGEDHR